MQVSQEGDVTKAGVGNGDKAFTFSNQNIFIATKVYASNRSSQLIH